MYLNGIRHHSIFQESGDKGRDKTNSINHGENEQADFQTEGPKKSFLDKNSGKRRSRLKREKMENMSNLCKNLQRGSVDLYQTMIQYYAESFEIKWEDAGDVDGQGEEEGKRRSLKKSEILLNRDLTLKELADTERSYVEGLRFAVEVIRILDLLYHLFSL